MNDDGQERFDTAFSEVSVALTKLRGQPYHGHAMSLLAHMMARELLIADNWKAPVLKEVVNK